MSGYFVTAVGTGVGKTFTTCALLHAARSAAVPMLGFKPVISGWSDNAATDTARIIAAGGGLQTVQNVSPWRFAAPLSPHLAAAKEDKTLTLNEVVAHSQCLLTDGAVQLIEGVGGVMVPLNAQHTTLDWMVALGLPVILVTGSYLGSISHCLTALAALKHAGIAVYALVMNESENSEVTFADAKEGLMPFIDTIALQIFQPRVSSYTEARAIGALAAHL